MNGTLYVVRRWHHYKKVYIGELIAVCDSEERAEKIRTKIYDAERKHLNIISSDLITITPMDLNSIYYPGLGE